MSTRTPRLRHGDIVRIRNERWRIVGCVAHGAAASVQASGCDRTNRAEEAHFLLPFEPFTHLPAPSAPRVVRPACWRRVARRALAEASPAWTSLRAATRANLTLIPFQLEPALALTRGEACRFLIADAVGLGKTVQAGLMIAETLARRPDARVLVMSPAGLREQWRDELRHRFGLDPDILDAAGVARVAARLPADANPWAVCPLIVTSIDYIKRPEVARALDVLTWDVVVMDEAHNLAGRSDRAAAAGLLGDRARTLVLLTATPHSGDDAAFARLCSLGRLSGTDPLVMFRRSRLDAGVTGARRAPLLRVRPTPEETAMHDALMAYARLVWRQADGASGARLVASILARRASSSAASLARSLERRLALLADVPVPDAVQTNLPFADVAGDDEEPSTPLAWPGLRDPAAERDSLDRLLGLARAAAGAESKVRVLRRLVSNIDEPAVIFTEYRDTLQQLAAAFSDLQIVQLHGGLTPRERVEALERFRSGGARLLLATDAGSEGLNLHHRCRLVINLELPWTPLRLEQRAGRVDRIGQTRRVHVVHLVAAGTCEESTLARLVRRMSRVRDAMSPFAQLPDEQRVAESVFDHRPLPRPSGASSAVAGIATLDLRHDAQAEAARISRARALLDRGGEPGAGDRPVLTRVRRRRGAAGPRCLWLFRVAYASASGRLVWESLVPVAADLAVSAPDRSASATRAALTPEGPVLQAVLCRTGDGLLAGLHDSVQRAATRWGRRERDLTDALRASHARLSAGLLQRGLFDRRDERIAAAQTLLLDRGLSQLEERLSELADCEHLRVDACDLVFAVILE